MFKCLLAVCLLLSGYVRGQNDAVLATRSESDLIPEGIAIDDSTKTIYVSSINRQKIIAVDGKGDSRDFLPTGGHGLMEALGMKIDTSRELLWVASVKKEGNLYHSKVHAFRLGDASLVHQFVLRDTNSHLLNDLVITSSGDIFVTDTYFGALYKIDAQGRFDIFLQHPFLKYPNGIAQIDKDRLVVATYANGPVLVDVVKKSVTKLPGAKDTTIAKGLDGLVFRGNKLYGVFNGGETQKKNAVIAYTLDTGNATIINEQLVDKGNDAFRDPTTAALSNGKLHVIANSYLTEYNNNKSSVKGIENQLNPVMILIYNVREN